MIKRGLALEQFAFTVAQVILHQHDLTARKLRALITFSICLVSVAMKDENVHDE